MAWKVEHWLADVFPGSDHIYTQYRSLTHRELAVVAAGSLDLALGELIYLRLQDYPAESEAFLGLNEDGRAPAATFGARIQLALLLGIITPSDASVLKTIKDIRNKFAHRINVGFTDPQVNQLVLGLHSKMLDQRKRLIDKGLLQGLPEPPDDIRPYLEIEPEAGAGLLLAVFCTYQAYFHRLHGLVQRVDMVRPSSG